MKVSRSEKRGSKDSKMKS